MAILLKHDAIVVVKFSTVSTAGDLQDSEKAKPFPPEYLERYFGEDGKIYGYKGLKVSEFTPGDYSQCSS
jgi:hypothetical protein